MPLTRTSVGDVPIPVERAWPNSRSGFTIVELLVVIGIIAVLMSLLVPAVLRARSAARRMQCLNRMRHVGFALNNYATSKGYYPGRVGALPTQMVDGRLIHPRTPVSWAVLILPELDRRDLYEMCYRVGGIDMHTRQLLRVAVCPSDVQSAEAKVAASSVGFTATSFAVNCGIPDAPSNPDQPDLPDSRANGVFHDLEIEGEARSSFTDNDYERRVRHLRQLIRASLRVTMDYIGTHDGLANTLLLSENIDAGTWDSVFEHDHGIVWNVDKPVGINVNAGERPGGKRRFDYATGRYVGREHDPSDLRYARPSSYHAGGVNMVFCDGRGQFVREDIEYWVYVQLMTPDGKRAMIDVNNKVLAPPEYRQLLSARNYE